MSESQRDDVDPGLLLEAARVLDSAGPEYRRIAEVIFDWALSAKERAAPEVRAEIVADAAAMRLSGRAPGGYAEAVDLLKTTGEDSDGWLHFLRALANGQKYREEQAKLSSGLAAASLSLTADQIRSDLEFALAKNPRLKLEYEHFWNPQKSGPPQEDDLKAVYENDPKFRELVAEPPADKDTGG